MGKVVLFSALMLVGFVMFVMQFVSQQEKLAEKTYPPQGQFIDVNGSRIHAVVMGSGPDLVLIHGSSGSTRDMTFSLAPQLAENFRVIVFDRPGLGGEFPAKPVGAGDGVVGGQCLDHAAGHALSGDAVGLRVT